MKRFDIAVVILLIVLFGGPALYLLNKGRVDRFLATFGQDQSVAADIVYQANGVRVYKFADGDTTCYMADDPQGGAGIYCLK